mmetsp:Transcript_95438/g.274917  ORF Transcript_95438/g.274917 Transcript_95438/m.274917 type:complete len:216 (+) Transcript_95438:215-862(+)
MPARVVVHFRPWPRRAPAAARLVQDPLVLQSTMVRRLRRRGRLHLRAQPGGAPPRRHLRPPRRRRPYGRRGWRLRGSSNGSGRFQVDRFVVGGPGPNRTGAAGVVAGGEVTAADRPRLHPGANLKDPRPVVRVAGDFQCLRWRCTCAGTRTVKCGGLQPTCRRQLEQANHGGGTGNAGFRSFCPADFVVLRILGLLVRRARGGRGTRRRSRKGGR